MTSLKNRYITNFVIFSVFMILFNLIAVRPLSIKIIFFEIVILLTFFIIKYRIDTKLTLNPTFKKDTVKPLKTKLKYALYFFLGGIGFSFLLISLWLFGVVSMLFTYESVNKLMVNIPILAICIPFLLIPVGYIYSDFKKNN